MQDIAVIPMLAILPLLALQELQVNALLSAVLNGEEIAEATGNGSIISQLPGWVTAIIITSAITIIIVASKYLTEPIIMYISNYGTREIFIAATFLLIISVAYLMTLLGLSPALGTFLVGLVLSNSQYRHALASDLDPFKGLLLGLFFITVGAGINFTLLTENLFLLISLTTGLIVIKGIIIYILAKIFLLESSSSILLALYLSQAGEFGFVLLALAKTAHVIPPDVTENLALIIALSMLITPLLLIIVQKLKFGNLPGSENSLRKQTEPPTRAIIIGMSAIGKTTSEILLQHGLEVIILDNSSSNIKVLRKKGIKAFLGDASDPNLLIKAGIADIEIVIIALEDRQKTINLTKNIAKRYPCCKVIVNAIDQNHYKILDECGAQEIILDTYHSSLIASEKALTLLGESSLEIKKTMQEFDRNIKQRLID